MKRKVLKNTLKRNKSLLILFAVTTAVNLSVFLLYRIMNEAFIYAELIILAFCFSMITADYINELKRAEHFKTARMSVENGNISLPPAECLEEEEYREMIGILSKKLNEMSIAFNSEKQDMTDWYTVWVHQIKTPVAVMKLNINENDKETARELFRIEEYADMALNYIRLGSEHNDLVIREYKLDELIREALRKYAPQFIAKKLRLEYSPTDKTVITDKKWLSCILEQYISNAVKYTEAGTVTVSVKGDTLTVADTGAGIAAEDLPRIFEKGFTGINGRTGEKSSGLGLYLSAKAAKLLNVALSAESTPGCGSRFSVTFPKNE